MDDATDAAMGAAVAAADGAGARIMEIYAGRFEASTKEDGSPVTEADLEADRIIREGLAGTGHPVMSEEGGGEGAGTFWLVDPLDGTADFVERTGEFTVMIALVSGGRPELGVIGWPAGGTIYAARRGGGARARTGGGWREICVSSERDPARCRALGSRHHRSELDGAVAAALGMELGTAGSSLKAARVATGEADAYVAAGSGMRWWDTAASCCIVAEAGGMMTDMSGNPLEYSGDDIIHRDGILATNGAVHGRIAAEYLRLRGGPGTGGTP